MYITKIYLKDIRCIKELTIDFDKPGASIIIAGDNGAGKSAILRSIAMGFCDPNSAASLLRELQGDFIRKRQVEGIIEIDLKRANGKKYRIRTTIKSLKAFERVYQQRYELLGPNNREREIKEEEDFPWESIFLSGYGAGIRTQGTNDFQHYVPADAVYPLFRYDVPLQNPELAIRRLVETARIKGKDNVKESQKLADEMLENIRKLLEPTLNLRKNDELILTPTGIQVKGYWGKSELGALGDGYRSTITWLLDLISWWVLYSKKKDPKTIRGVVIVDEIEQHLHPQWQLKIMDLLSKAWPRIQFITSTHSPLVLSGSEKSSVWTIKDGTAKKHKVFGWLAEDVYRQMGLESSRATNLKMDIKEYEELYYKKLTGKITDLEKRKFNKIKIDIMKLPSHDPIETTSELRAIREYFIKHRKESKS